MTNILDLPPDCLGKIFADCDYNTNCNIRKACPYFNSVADEYIFRYYSRDLLMCGYRAIPTLAERTLDNFSHWERINVSENWCKGRFRQGTIPNPGCRSRLLLEKNYFCMSNKDEIFIHERDEHKVLCGNPCLRIGSKSNDYIMSFVKKNDVMFAANKFRTAFIHENGKSKQFRVSPYKYPMLSVDFQDDIYVTGSADATRLWRRTDEGDSTYLTLLKYYEVSSKALAFVPHMNILYLGMLQWVGLREIDLETGEMIELRTQSGEVEDMEFKDSNVIFTANRMGAFRMYDRRVYEDVGHWTHSCRNLLSVKSDGLHGALCGSTEDGKVFLLDIRSLASPVQVYQPFKMKSSAPLQAFDIACDYRYLFVATHDDVNIFDFKTGDLNPKQRQFHKKKEKKKKNNK